MTKKELHADLDRLDLERLRRDKEFADKVEADLIDKNESVLVETEMNTVDIAHRFKHRKRVITKFKQNLDLTCQEDADRYSFEVLYNKYVNGEQLPPFAFKQGEFTEQSISDSDLTDLMLINQHYKEKYGEDLKGTLELAIKEATENDNDLNDDDKESLHEGEPKIDPPSKPSQEAQPKA